jgi:hypothetical protein
MLQLCLYKNNAITQPAYPLGSEEPSVSEAYKQRDSEDKKKQREKIKGKDKKMIMFVL